MEGQPPAKRAHTEIEDSLPNDIVIDKDIWLVDPIDAEDTSGLIVVAAQEASTSIWFSTRRLFRCFKLDLARHTGIFQDMLKVGKAIDCYEGVAMVTLPDAAEDVKSLLKVLMDGPCVTVYPGLYKTERFLYNPGLFLGAGTVGRLLNSWAVPSVSLQSIK